MESNETRYVDGVKTIGVLELPPAAVGENTIDYSGKMSTVFYDHMDGEMPPSIQVNRTAFMVVVKDGSDHIKDSFKAIIAAVRDYSINQVTDEFHIKFNYRRPDADKRTGVVTIKPVVSGILAYGSYIALHVEGDRPAVKDYVDKNLQMFYHGTKTYFNCRNLLLTQRLDPSNVHFAGEERFPTGMLVIGCTQNLPDRSELNVFVKRAHAYFGYPINENPEVLD